MRSLGNRAVGATIDFKFNTHDTSGAPITLAGTPAISVYKDNGTTESTAGVTLSVDQDSRTGMHHVRITTASDGTFYSAGSFQVVITTGTVDGISVVGVQVADFTLGVQEANVIQWDGDAVDPLEDSRDIVAAMFTQDSGEGYSSAVAGSVVAEIANNGSGLDAAGVRDAIGLATANLDTQLGAIETDTQDIQSRIPAALDEGHITASVKRVGTTTLTGSGTGGQGYGA